MAVFVSMLLWGIGLYAAFGVVTGVWIVFAGLGRVDPVAADSPWAFRLMVLPGLVGLWPVMLVKWVRAGEGDRA